MAIKPARANMSDIVRVKLAILASTLLGNLLNGPKPAALLFFVRGGVRRGIIFGVQKHGCSVRFRHPNLGGHTLLLGALLFSSSVEVARKSEGESLGLVPLSQSYRPTPGEGSFNRRWRPVTTRSSPVAGIRAARRNMLPVAGLIQMTCNNRSFTCFGLYCLNLTCLRV
nr:hypothetical protein Iba_chr04aCG14590 [Ipomoea batatas]